MEGTNRAAFSQAITDSRIHQERARGAGCEKKVPHTGTSEWENRKFRFDLSPSLLKDGLGTAQLTLILKPQGLSDDCHLIAWQVFNIDGRSTSFNAILPPDRGFGDVMIEEDLDTIAGISYACSKRYAFAPPGWQVTLDHEDGILYFSEPLGFSKKRSDHIMLKNNIQIPQHIIIGSYHRVGGRDDHFQPFVLIRDVHDNLVTRHGLHLQIYLTDGVRVGQVMMDALFQYPLLSPSEGVPITEFEPGSTTTWTVQDQSGTISLVQKF